MCRNIANLNNLLGELIQVDAVLATESFAQRVQIRAYPSDQDVLCLGVNILILRFD